MYEQKVRTLSFDELLRMYQDNVPFVLADARPRQDYDKKHIPGAISLPVDDVKIAGSRLDKDVEIVTYCGGFHCPASTMAARELMKLGFKNVRDFKGGVEEWTGKGYPTESS